MVDYSEDSYPTPDKTDKVHKAGKFGVSGIGTIASYLTGIPGLNVIATELYSLILKPPVEQRQINWFNSFSERIKKLENERSEFSITNLTDNQLFITITMHAIQIAARNHQKEKLEALQNAALNSALQVEVDEDEQLMFLNYIDIFIQWHLKLLRFIQNKSVLKGYDSNNYPKNPIALEYGILEKEYPELSGKSDFYIQIFNDLSSRGLITDEVKNMLTSLETKGNKAVGNFITSRGKRFLDFITEPMH